MDRIDVVCVLRAAEFSPGLGAADTAIMQSVVARLRAEGHSVAMLDETELTPAALSGCLVALSMGRRRSTLAILEEAAQRGLRVVNSPASVAGSSHVAVARAFREHGVAMPATVIVDTAAAAPTVALPAWVKCGEGYTRQPADTVYCTTSAALAAALADMHRRGIKTAVIQHHEKGDLVKFYGIHGTPLLSWRYGCEGHSKFGQETVNGQPHHYAFSRDSLAALCSEACAATGLTVYGGDCIVTADGRILLIDFNDWPSFASCRDAAAEAITSITITLCRLYK